jgi:DNA polymerase-4
MPLRLAVRKCPEAVLLPVDFPVYEEISARVMETLRAVPGTVVEVLGWDEAFVGVETDDPEATAREIQTAVLEATELHCSIGIGDTLVRAKIATDFGKPRGTFTLTRDNWLDFMGARPTTALWGVGKKIGARLSALGLETVAQLAASPVEPLIEEFGPTNGPHLLRLGQGAGRRRPDDTPWVPRARGRETTYQVNLTTEQVPAAIHELAARVIDDLRQEGRACARVHLKVRFAPFFTQTKVRKLAEPTYDVGVVADTATAMFHELDDSREVRLLGVRGEMVPPEGGY